MMSISLEKLVPQSVRDSLAGKAERVVTATVRSTASYTLALTDSGNAVETTNTGAVAVTVPTNASVAFPIGTVIEVTQIGTGQVTLTPAAGVTLLSRGGALKTAGQYAIASIRKRGTNEWVVGGDVTV